MNGAESLIRTLLAGGVETCFTNPGTSEIHIVAALDRIAEMRCVLGPVSYTHLHGRMPRGFAPWFSMERGRSKGSPRTSTCLLYTSGGTGSRRARTFVRDGKSPRTLQV